MEDQIIAASLDIFRPVMESAMILAAKYAQACGRDIVMVEDIHLGLMFSARNVTGRHVGTLFPEEEESSDSDRDSDEEDEDFDPEGDESASADSDGSWETVSDSELVWTRYEGTEDEMAVKMNECAETWDSWEPETPAESALKNAVDMAKTRGQIGMF